MRNRTARAAQVALTAALALCSLACSSDATASGPLRVAGAWARTTVAGQTTGAAYFTIETGRSPDVLTGVRVPPSVAGDAMLHQTTTSGSSGADMPGMDMSGDSGMSSMQAVGDLQIAAGTIVAFAPGGYHVMLMDLARPLDRGSHFTLTLTFRDAGDVPVPVTVKDRA